MKIDIINILITLGKSHLYVLYIVIGSFIIEKFTGLKLFIYDYFWVKSPRNAEDGSNRDAGLYLIINCIVFGYNIYHGRIEFNIFNIIIWVIIISILTKIFYKIHRKYQKVDPNKADDDYT